MEIPNKYTANEITYYVNKSTNLWYYFQPCIGREGRNALSHVLVNSLNYYLVKLQIT